MNCYLCRDRIEDGQPFYNDYDHHVCKPCFVDAPRCFICRFPGKDLQDVPGLGLECEFCRNSGNLIVEGDDLTGLLAPLAAFLKPFNIRVPTRPSFVWRDRAALRALQTASDLPPELFIDDFLRYAYPIYYHDGRVQLLRRMTRQTFLPYAVVALACGEIAGAHALPDLRGETPFHVFTRGWCHWLGFEAATLLGYDLERRQLRKWPELGLMGEFERWERMARVNARPKMLAYFRAHLKALAAKHLFEASAKPGG